MKRINFSGQTSIKRLFVWNTVSTVTYAGMSTLMLWIVVRVCGTEDGGIFSITFSIAQMLQTIALFGVRNYQVTDFQSAYTFSEYLTARGITSLFMIVLVGVYCWTAGFQGEKLIALLLLCAIKLAEAVGDVFEGEIQQHKRLDNAAKSLFLRTSSIILIFCIVVALTQNLLLSLAFSVIVAFLGLPVFTFPFSKEFGKIALTCDFSRVFRLLRQCLPLFLSCLLLLYISNAPKVAIDRCLPYEMQTYFGVLFLPAMLINMFSGFAFRPLLNQLTELYVDGSFRSFFRCIGKLMLWIIIVEFVIEVGAWFCGVQILSWIYGIDLSTYRNILFITILGGGFCALVSLTGIILTITRKQNIMLLAYGLISVLALIFSQPIVHTWGLMGAASLYALSMCSLFALLAIIFGVTAFIEIKYRNGV